MKIKIMTKKIIVHHWISMLCSYYEDYVEFTKNGDEKHAAEAEMALELIPQFLRDLNIKTIRISRVMQYSYDMPGFLRYMQKHHPYISVECEEIL